MKTRFRNLLVAITSLTAVTQAQAVITLSLEPVLQAINVGDSASVDVVITGLGNLASPSLGGFDIDLTYDSAVVSANSLTFGSGLGSSSQFSDLSTDGLIHLDEVSFESAVDLNGAQLDSFVLATLGFTGFGQGVSPLVFALTSLSDENGVTIDQFSVNTAAIEVLGPPSVPDGGDTAVLLCSGITALLTLRSRLGTKSRKAV